MNNIAKDFLRLHLDDYQFYDAETTDALVSSDTSYRNLLFALFACVQVDIISNPERWMLNNNDKETMSLKEYKNILSKRVLCDVSTLETMVENTWREHGYPIDDAGSSTEQMYPCLVSCINFLTDSESKKSAVYSWILHDLQWLLQHTAVLEHACSTDEDSDTESSDSSNSPNR
jgi:hypothetical protein